MKRVYGANDTQGLLASYEAWKAIATLSDEERELKGYPSLPECYIRALQEIDSEIVRLNRYQTVRASMESERRKLEVLRRGIPDAHRLDPLLRYEASLERAFDRTLSQLERLQRMRLGHAVPPPLKVEISG